MDTCIFGPVHDEVNPNSGIPCHDAGEEYPWGWCPACRDEAESRRLLSMSYRHAAHAACCVPAGPPDLGIGGPIPAMPRSYARQVAALAILDAIDDHEMEAIRWENL